jgi:signal transduction histidine kinase
MMWSVTDPAGKRSALASLLQMDAEHDSGFRLDIHRGSLLSLRLVGMLEVVLPSLMLLAGLPLIPLPKESANAALPNLLFAALGVGTALSASTPAGKSQPRLFTLASIWASVVAMLGSAMYMGIEMEWIQHHLRGYIVLVLFGAAAAVPIRPLEALGLGLAIHATLLAAQAFMPMRFAAAGLSLPAGEQLFLLVLVLLCTLVAASVYRQRYSGYRNHQQALQTSEKLRETESKLLISQNAAMMGRVAAALSHELNSPIGALASSVDILEQVARRMAEAPPESRTRLEAVLDEAAASGRDSARRLKGIVGRMQRFTNLDRAEIQSADLNDLLRDVVAIAEAGRPQRWPVIMDLHAMARFQCRPQQISAVFANLLNNAMDAVGESGRVRVVSGEVNSPAGSEPDGRMLEIRIEDSGKGIAAAQLSSLFDPAAFRTANGRVTAGNWSLFSCRQIIEEHGGEITVASSESAGTTVCVRLPSTRPAIGLE